MTNAEIIKSKEFTSVFHIAALHGCEYKGEQIVRCKDCKYWEDGCWGTAHSGDDPDFFCADGERDE